MRDHSSHVTVSREKAVELMLAACDFDQKAEVLPIEQAIGRVLADDVYAKLDMPNCLTCLMDSVAVHYDDFENGMPDTTGWQRGVQWEFANTGIGMPEGFDTAIVIEHVQLSDDLSQISFDAAPSKRFAGTREKGSKMKEGELLIWGGTVLTPYLAAHAASGGNAEVSVVVKPRVAFIPTGNELVPVGAELPRGKNFETNSLLIRGKIEQWGGEAIVYDIVPDDPELLRAAILRACDEADIVVMNAGSSKGSDDYNIEVLEELGQVLYHETNHGPGHHSSGSVVNGTPVVGISGPPNGAMFTTDFYLKPLIQRFLGQNPFPQTLVAKLAADFPSAKKGGHGHSHAPAGEKRPDIAADGQDFYGIKHVYLSQDEKGVLIATPAGSPRPGPVEADGTDALFAMPSGIGAVKPEKGDLIRVELRAQRL